MIDNHVFLNNNMGKSNQAKYEKKNKNKQSN